MSDAPAPDRPFGGLVRNASLQFVTRAGAGVLQGTTLLLAARHLGPTDYGRLALVITLRTMLLVVAELGLVLVVVRLQVREGEERWLSTVLGLRLALGVLAALTLVGGAFAASDAASVHVGAAIAGLSYLPFAYFGIVQTRAQHRMQLGGAAVAALCGAAAALTWTGAVVLMDGGVVALSASLVVGSIVSAITGLILAPGPRLPLRPTFDLRLWRRLARDALPLGLAFGLVNVYLYIDLALLSRLSSPEQVGYYDGAYRFVQFGILIPAAITSSLYARASGYADTDRERFADLASGLVTLAATLAPIPILVMSVAPRELLTLLYGAPFGAGDVALRWLGPALALMILTGVIGPMLISLGRDGVALRLSAAAAVLNIGLNLVLIPELDAEGAAITTLVTEAVVLAVAVTVLRQYARLRPPARTVLVAGTAAAAGVGLALAIDGPVVLRLGLAVALYLAAVTRFALPRALRREDPLISEVAR